MYRRGDILGCYTLGVVHIGGGTHWGVTHWGHYTLGCNTLGALHIGVQHIGGTDCRAIGGYNGYMAKPQILSELQSTYKQQANSGEVDIGGT